MGIIEEKELRDYSYLDIKKAFDTVDHKKLLEFVEQQIS